MRKRKVSIPKAEINITSLLDITFVLLIAFMIVAPAIQYSVDLELPQVGDTGLSTEKKPVTLQMSSAADGSRIFVNGSVSSKQSVVSDIRSSDGWQDDTPVSFEADRGAAWQDIAELLTILRDQGIANVGVVTERRGQ